MKITVAIMVLALASIGLAQAEDAVTKPNIVRCGKSVSDRPDPSCAGKPQEELNPSGSVRAVIPPTRTTKEQENAEEQARIEEEKRVATKVEAKKNANLLKRYPTQAKHDQARKKALEDVERSLVQSQNRIQALADERKKLDNESEFYIGKPLPSNLKLQIDNSDASIQAENGALINRRIERDRINRKYDDEREVLRKLWAS